MEKLLENILIEADFINKDVIGIYSTEKKLKPWASSLIYILSTRSLDKLAVTTAARSEEKVYKISVHSSQSVLNHTVKLTVARRASIKPRSILKLWVVTIERGLI